MNFLFPDFLWALPVLAVPVIIHLFNFRKYKKLIFPNVRMLRQIETRSRSGNRLRNLLILISRMAAVLFLILAFAQPYIPHGKAEVKGKRFVSIILDNSASMNPSGPEGQLLEAAKNRARSIISVAGNTDEIQLVTADMNPELLHFTDRQQALELLDGIKISNITYPLQTLLNLQKAALKEKNGNLYAYCISDFQNSTSKLNDFQADSNINMTWMRITGAQSENLSVDTCFLRSPVLITGEPATLVCRVSNYRSSPVNGISMELWIDGKPKGMAVFDIASWSSSEREIVFTIERGGMHKCELKLSGDQIAADDVLYFSLMNGINSEVTAISNTREPYIRAVFEDNPGFRFRDMQAGAVDFSILRQQNLIVLHKAGELSSGTVSEMQKFAGSGGTIFVFPDPVPDFGGLNKLAAATGFTISEKSQETNIRVTRMDAEHPLFTHIFEKKPVKPDLPVVKRYFSISANRGTSFMKLADGQPYMLDIPVGKGHIFLSSVALDPAFGNLQNHALFVPLCIRAALLSEYVAPLYHLCSYTGDIYTGLPYRNDAGLKLKGELQTYMPEAQNRDGSLYLNTNGSIGLPGHFELTDNRDSAFGMLAFNYDRIESDPRCADDEQFLKLCETAGAEPYAGTPEQLETELHKLEKGTQLWKWCVVFSLICLLIEILLIRFFRTNASLPV